ncbi:MAG: 50S ribosomal protein L10 [Gammaproteobacteria bacterium]|nr:MAG: 50S ribosomal protein L10 [Gammaproteobacteria bacterium]
MSLTLEQKQEIVSEVAGVVAQAKSAVVAEYRGMTVSELTELRSNARKMDVYLRVVKNTLARRAMQGTEFACMDDALVGPLLLALSRVEPGDAPKLMGNFAKGHERLVIKAGAYNGKLLKPADIAALAKLPTRNEAIAILMSLMKAPVGKLVRTLAAVRDARQAA